MELDKKTKKVFNIEDLLKGKSITIGNDDDYDEILEDQNETNRILIVITIMDLKNLGFPFLGDGHFDTILYHSLKENNHESNRCFDELDGVLFPIPLKEIEKETKENYNYFW